MTRFKPASTMICALLVFSSVVAILPQALAQQPKRNLLTDVLNLKSFVDTVDGSPDHIASSLEGVYQEMFEISPRAYDRRQVKAQASELIPLIFQAQMDLRNKIETWNREGKMTPAVQMAIRNIFRAARYASDMVGEVAINNQNLAGKPGEGFVQGSQAPGTGIANPYLVQARGASGPIHFQSGDVIMERGKLFTSSAIARMSTVSGQFSHLILVYVDPQGQAWGVEALIEYGLVVHKLSDDMNEGVSDMVLFRYHDPQQPSQSAAIAARAAKILYNRAMKAAETGVQIPYDFSMQLNNYKKMFCTKVVREAYDEATNGRIMVPMFESNISPKYSDFLSRIGETATTTFTPTDMELDPRFQEIAEWRNFAATGELTLKDVVISSELDWMREYGMKFHPDLPVRILSADAKAASLTPGVSQLITAVFDKIPNYMKIRQIEGIIMLTKTSQDLAKPLRQLNDENIAKYHVPLSPRHMFEILNSIRIQGGSNGVGYLGY